MNDTVTVESYSVVYPTMRRRVTVPHGKSVADMLDTLGIVRAAWGNLRVFLNGFEALGGWEHVTPKAGTVVNVAVLPAGYSETGRKELLRTIVGIIGPAAGQMIGGTPGAIVGTFLGTLINQTLIPVPALQLDAQSLSVSGVRNEMRQWEAVPKVYGCVRYAPPLAAEAISRAGANQNSLTALLCAGEGPLLLDAPRVGDKWATQIEGVLTRTSTGALGPNDPLPNLLRYFPSDIHREDIARKLEQAETWQDTQRPTRDHVNVVKFTTQPNSVCLEIDIEFPNGLGIRTGSDPDNDDMQWTGGYVDFFVQYRPKAAGNDGWIPLLPIEAKNDPDIQTNVAALYTIVNEDWWAFLGVLTGQILGIAGQLDELATATAGIEQGTYDMAMDRLGFLTLALNSARTPLQDGNELTPEQVAQVDQLAGVLMEISAIFGRIAIVSAEVAAGLTTLGNAMTAIMGIMEIIDGAIVVRRAIDDVHYQDFDTLPLFAQMWACLGGYDRYFKEIPETAFRIRNADAVTGAYTKTLVFAGLTPGLYDVRIRRATKDNRTTGNAWWDFTDWFDWDENVAVDACNVKTVRSIAANPPLSDFAARRYALALVEARSSEEVNGSLDAVSFRVRAPLQWHDGTQWRKWSFTDDDGRDVYRNPAWCFVDALRGSKAVTGGIYGDQVYNLDIAAVQRPADTDRIDLARIIEWAEYCFTNGYHFDFVYDKKTNWRQVLRDICSAGKATQLIRDGLWSVAIDQEQTTAAAVVCARNCRDFQASKSFRPTPHALRVKFVNEDADYQADEMMVYDDGYGDPMQGSAIWDKLHAGGGVYLDHPDGIPYRLSVTSVTDMDTGTEYGAEYYTVGTDFETATKTYLSLAAGGSWGEGARRWRVQGTFNPIAATIFETLEPPGITDPDHVFKWARYMLACNKLRPETFVVTMDYERLVFERGDRVDIQHDVVLWGLGSARIVSVTLDAGLIESITVDQDVTRAVDTTYQAMIRTAANATLTGTMLLIESGETVSSPTIEFDPPLDPGALTVAAGDLVVWGESSLVTAECVAKEIRGNADRGAQITFVEHAPAVHYADVSLIPPHDSRITLPVAPSIMAPDPPSIQSIVTDESAIIRVSGGLQSRIVMALGNIGPTVGAVEVQYRIDSSRYGTPDAPLYLAVADDASALRGPWERVPYFTAALDRVNAAPVQDGHWYEVRVRAITAAGMASDWTVQPGIYVVGKASPPPDVLTAWYAEGQLRWEYRTPPIDHAGFRVRCIVGAGGSWTDGAAAHDGLVRDTVFQVPNHNGGPRVFFVKAVDVVGNESNRAARVVVDLGDVTLDNVILRTSHATDGWTGTKAGAVVSGGKLVGGVGSKTLAYRRRGLPAYCQAPAGSGETDGEQPFYTTDYPYFEYLFEVTPTADDLPYMLSVQANVSQGENWRLEYRQDNAEFWPQNLASRVWPAKASYAAFPDWQTWKPLTEKLVAVEGVKYEFRLASPACNTQMIVDDIVVVRDVADVLERVVSFAVAATGTVRLPITRTFRSIETVSITLEQDGGYPDAATVELIDKDETNGPAVVVYDATHSRVSGVISATIQGY